MSSHAEVLNFSVLPLSEHLWPVLDDSVGVDDYLFVFTVWGSVDFRAVRSLVFVPACFKKDLPILIIDVLQQSVDFVGGNLWEMLLQVK